MSKHISVVFPGQGSQSQGMTDIFSPDELNNIGYINPFDFDLLDIINHDEEKLNKSYYTQPALVLTSLLYYQRLKNILPNQPNILAGHSLGEYSALVASNAIDLHSALKLVYKRGKFMSESKNGSMMAVMGATLENILNVCDQINKEENENISAANLNSPNQIVLGGLESSVDIAAIKLKELGAKRCIKLKVATASHCKLLDDASKKLENELNLTEFIEPEIDVIQNINASISLDTIHIKQNLVNQLTNPVQWIDTMNQINQHQGIIIECGPGKVLSGLAKANGCENILTMSSPSFEDDLRNML
ncbi:MAG: ACP S-malonyltransferase [Gammaproteobacteria bacterium]